MFNVILVVTLVAIMPVALSLDRLRQKRRAFAAKPTPALPSPVDVHEAKKDFERLLESCGFRIFRLAHTGDKAFDKYSISIGDREYDGPCGELDGVRIAYGSARHAECCRGYTFYRLAQPVFGRHGVPDSPGLGPSVCCVCGRIERDYAGDPDGIGGLVGSFTNIFPVLDALARRDGEYADRARLATLERERGQLEDRLSAVDQQIGRLRARLPELPGEGPYRKALVASLDDPPDDRAKTMPALKDAGE